MSIAEQATLTLDEFLQLPDTNPASEYWNGYVRQKPMPTTKHSVIQGELTENLNVFSKLSKPRKGRALPELRCTFGGRSIVPDIVYIRRERLPLEPNGQLADRFLKVPDLLVEYRFAR
jgi:Uma2 family endonuclease